LILPGDDPQAIAQGARALAAGELVAFPTETVYGLGARADDDAAVARIFAAKGRPAEHPLIVHVAGADALPAFATDPGPLALRLIERFWPGPLTVIVRRAEGVAAAAAGGQPTIGLRCPAHPVARALLEAARGLGVPGVAAPSANRFGRVSPTTAAHVAAEFEPSLLVLDGGACPEGIESTIVDCTRDAPALLRPGTLPRGEIERVLGLPLRARDAAAPRAPGTLAAHYAPNARVRLMSAQMLRDALAVLGAEAKGVAVYSRTVRGGRGVVQRTMPDDARAAAFELFAVLRELDALGVRLIWVEEPPASPEWDGVRDRLLRAAAA
jgi:L-threonylcarbamoyladenylate synthase